MIMADYRGSGGVNNGQKGDGVLCEESLSRPANSSHDVSQNSCLENLAQVINSFYNTMKFPK